MISDVSELVVEAARISGRNDLAAYAPMLLGFLEAHLNRELRTDDMVAEATLTTDAAGAVALPSDYLETVTLTYGTDKQKLRRLSRYMLNEGVSGYYISGGSLLSSETEQAHALTYYQALPGLWANDTNWLLQAYPEVYLRGLVFEAHKDANNADAAVQSKAVLDIAIDVVKADDRRARRADHVSLPRTQI